ncbi:hypothetical protein SARC_08143 [Sphaeroforma arctica JP610]|uniref:Uncharacterized protein n=1 Tax=Sphaeroforma arctica JP610 TaxID=667725 RepID=A0A0L0FRL5_9EUKA|nr:hypothetical protein SARC_08143 [Sphaeroforma arctica JP610]KNC79467.1 hypothetical protein SARC_08143 [Sphaeroforma arctica JP610]|eukprot:XP_014153369.1 hypothetical protein SARC_08143 [Sphaeroforma arctica JP610]
MKRVGKTVHEEKDSSWSPRGSLKKVTATIREGMQTLTELAQAASVTTLDSDAFTFDFSITEDDLIPGKTGRELFLDKFSEKDVAKWMEDKGVLDILRKKGFKDCVLDFDLSGMTVDKFRIYDLGVKVPGKNGVLLDCKDPLAVKPSAKNNIMPYHLTHDNYTSTSQYDDPAEKPPNDIPPIVEAAIRLKFDLQKSHAMRMATAGVERDGDLILPRSTHRETYEFLHKLEEADVNFLYVEWLLLQNVTKELDGHLHNALPGQLYPGLGIMEPMAEILLTKIVEGRDVVLNNPLYFHNAIMYRDLPGTVFLNPEYEGGSIAVVSWNETIASGGCM